MSGQVWTKKADYPFGSGWFGTAAFAINGKGYVGAAGTGDSSLLRAFFEYDSFLDSWTQRSSFPDSALTVAASFSIGSKGYVGAGWNGSRPFITFFEYDAAMDLWTRKANFPGSFSRVTLFTSAIGKGYVGGGVNSSGSAGTDFWQFDPVQNTWSQLVSLPNGGRAAGVAFAIIGLIYITYGHDFLNDQKDLWMFNPTTNT